MLGFVVRQLRHRRGRVATLASGILVAAASFVLLTSAAQTSELQVKGTVAKNFRAAYDILVRPKDSFSPIETNEGLVRENYLSGIYGGVTFKQYRQVKRIPGVEVAAPIANVGYILPFHSLSIPITNLVNKDPVQLYRLDLTWRSQRGLSSYPPVSLFIYYTRVDRFTHFNGPNFTGKLGEVVPGHRKPVPLDGYYDGTSGATSPFDPRNYSHLKPFDRNAGDIAISTDVSFPLAIAAIDPVEEARLLHLDEAVVQGRYLRESDRLRILDASRKRTRSQHFAPLNPRVVPFLASTKTFVDDRLRVAITRLSVPPGASVPLKLSSTKAYGFVHHLDGTLLAHRTFAPYPFYQRLLREWTSPYASSAQNGYWTSSGVDYQQLGRDTLRPIPIHNPNSVWFSNFYGGFMPAPADNADLQFRKLKEQPASNLISGNSLDDPSLHVVGRFDPNRLPGFSTLSQVPLETYYPPTLTAADSFSRHALKGASLTPTANLADYIAQPPLMLTSMRGLKTFINDRYFPGVQNKVPISVIRVRVAGIHGPDPLSRERIKAVATSIHHRTGLAVDITAGSSPHTMKIELPAGKFGRPALTLKEGWVEKGVAVRFLDAVDKKSLFLFSLILLVCGLFLANAALASVRARRTEIGTLLCLGWSRASIFRAIVAELAVVGALAGIAGTVLALIAVPLLSLHISLLRTLLVAPVAVIVAIIAGLLPAWRAARGRPMDALSPPVTGGDHRRHVSHILGMALANTVRIPTRTLVAITGLVFGVGALTVLIALNRALQGTLVGTLMGHFISSQIRGVDFLSVLLVIALGGLSVADILFLNLSERSAELVTLRTVGWRDQHLRVLIGLEGIATGALGCLIGAALGIGVAALIRGVPITTIALAAAVAAGAGLIVTVLAALLPLIRITTLTPPTVLAEE